MFFGNSFSIAVTSSSSSISLLLMAMMNCLCNNSGLYFPNSLCNISNSFLWSLLSAGIKKSKTGLRSICRRKRWPNPLPSAAPSSIRTGRGCQLRPLTGGTSDQPHDKQRTVRKRWCQQYAWMTPELPAARAAGVGSCQISCRLLRC